MYKRKNIKRKKKRKKKSIKRESPPKKMMKMEMLQVNGKLQQIGKILQQTGKFWGKNSTVTQSSRKFKKV